MNRQQCNILLMETLPRLESTFHSSSPSTPISNHLKLSPAHPWSGSFVLPPVVMHEALAKAYGVGEAWHISGIGSHGSLAPSTCCILSPPGELTALCELSRESPQSPTRSMHSCFIVRIMKIHRIHVGKSFDNSLPELLTSFNLS